MDVLGTFLDGAAAGRFTAGTGEPEQLPGRFALAGFVDAHAHPTVAADEHGPYLADGATAPRGWTSTRPAG